MAENEQSSTESIVCKVISVKFVLDYGEDSLEYGSILHGNDQIR